MNEKLNFHDLVGLLAEKAGITKKDAENFLREFFDLTTNALLEDKQVKIKNLGTFKIVDVNDRESVDVRTGERVVIPSHSKVSFVPDTTLSKVVNEPFAMFEPVEVEEEEVTGSYRELMGVKGIDETENGETDDSRGELHSPVTKTIPDNEPSQEPDDAPLSSPVQENPVQENIIEPDSSKTIAPKKQKNKKNRRKSKGINIIIVCCAIIILGTLFFILKNDEDKKPSNYYVEKTIQESDNEHIEETKDNINPDENFINENEIIQEDSINNPEEQTNIEIKPEIIEKQPEIIVEKTNQNADRYTIVDGVRKRKIAEGERLTIISLQEYGSKDFWVYLYEENKSTIKNPENIVVGTSIIIPPASKYGIDKNNPESINKAREMQKRLK